MTKLNDYNAPPKKYEGGLDQLTLIPMRLIYTAASSGDLHEMTVLPTADDRRAYETLALRNGWPQMGSDEGAPALLMTVMCHRAAQRHPHCPPELKTTDLDKFSAAVLDLVPLTDDAEPVNPTTEGH